MDNSSSHRQKTVSDSTESDIKVGDNWYSRFCIIAPFLLCFSYLPGVNLGQMNGFNAKISLGEVFILLFALGFLVFLFTYQREFVLNRLKIHAKLVFPPLLFILYQLFSLTFAANQVRGLFEVGVLFCFFLIFLWGVIALPDIIIIKNVTKFMVYAAITLSSIAICEVIWGAFSDVGLCNGCVPTAGFGFVRPSVFAIEPQFLGSLLIIPVFYLVYSFAKNTATRFEKCALILTLIALFSTLSRGAIYATVIGVLVLFIFLRFKGFLKIFAIFLLTFLISVGLDMVAVGLNRNVDANPLNVPAIIISQHSLGTIELPRFSNASNTSNASNDAEQADNNSVTTESTAITPAFDHYIEKSTDERNTSTSNALRVWGSSTRNALFGVGIGSAGQAVLDAKLNGTPYEIIQNQYISTLLELGIIGFTLFLGMIIALYMMFIKHRQYLFVGILTAFLVQWWFFSGLPNALHIYFALPLLAIWANRDYLTPSLH